MKALPLIVVAFLTIILIAGCGGGNTPVAQDIPYPSDSVMNDPGDIINAGNPRFNFMNGDIEFVLGGQDELWSDPVSANPGDVINVLLYVHNGVVDSLAVNTMVHVNLPADDGSLISASLSADNTETITDTVINGEIVGLPGLTINTPSSCQLTYVPGSTKMYKTADPGEAIQMPDGICSADGLRVGNVAGCWQFIRHIVFQVRVG